MRDPINKPHANANEQNTENLGSGQSEVGR